MHRWFNNREAISSLMEVRPSFEPENAKGWTNAAVAAAGDEGGEDRKWAIEVEGIDEPVGFTALYGLFRQTAPELGALIGDDPRCQGRRPGGRAPDRRQGLRGVRRPPRLRADPVLQRARQEGGHLAGLAARGHDARAHPPPRRNPDRLRDLGHLGRRLARALVGRRRPGELDRRGRADLRRGCGGRRDRRLLPQPRVLRRRGGHSHARRRRRLEPRLRPVARPPDPGDRSPRCDLALLVSGGAGRGRPDRSGGGRPERLRARLRLRPRPPRRAARVHRRHRPLGRPRLRPGRAAQVADERSSADPQERGGRLRDLASRGPRGHGRRPRRLPHRLHRDDARRRCRRPLLLRRRLLPDAARLTADLADHGGRPRRRLRRLGPRRRAATASCTTTCRAPPTSTAAGPPRRT